MAQLPKSEFTQMQGAGLREVTNPSEVLITKKDELLSGNAIAATLEGVRPMLIEIQHSVSTAVLWNCHNVLLLVLTPSD